MSRSKTRSAKARPVLTSTPATVQVSGHGVPIHPDIMHTLVAAVSTTVEERLGASDQLLHQAIGAVAADVGTIPAACYTYSLPGATSVDRWGTGGTPPPPTFQGGGTA